MADLEEVSSEVMSKYPMCRTAKFCDSLVWKIVLSLQKKCQNPPVNWGEMERFWRYFESTRNHETEFTFLRPNSLHLRSNYEIRLDDIECNHILSVVFGPSSIVIEDFLHGVRWDTSTFFEYFFELFKNI